MIKKIIQIITISTISLFIFSNSNAEDIHFIDFKKVLNQSKAGAKAQNILKKKLDDASKKFKKQEADLRKQEQEIISQKKLITNEEFKKKVEALRKKVADLQKQKQDTFNNIGKSRSDAKKELLKAVNPIMKKRTFKRWKVIAGDIPIIICGNKKDIKHKKHINRSKYPYVEITCK